jgi:hypothetical protein
VKKFAIGCLVILVLGAIVLAVGGFFLYRAASPMIDNARAYVENASKLGDLEKDIKNRATYTAPANDELSQAQVERFVRVQKRVRGSLGQRFEEIEAKYQHLKGNADSTRQVSMTEALAAVSDLLGVFTQARRYQVDALNQEGFSSSEYSWVRERVYQAAGVEVTSVVDFQKIAEAARQGTGIESIRVPETSDIVPPRNRELVKPYVSQMDEWLPLAFFGL